MSSFCIGNYQGAAITIILLNVMQRSAEEMGSRPQLVLLDLIVSLSIF